MLERLLSTVGGKYKSTVSMIKLCSVTKLLELFITQQTFTLENQT